MTLFLESHALLLAIAAPVLTLGVINLFLALGGERGTLMLPSAGPLAMVRRAANRLPAAARAVARATSRFRGWPPSPRPG